MQTNQSISAPVRVEPVSNIPKAQRKTVETLQADDCRWPFGDPMSADFHFCGHRKKDGSPYCEVHMRLAFQAAKPRAVYRPHAA
ncbi:GcrA family cell cycle regulator [Hyphomicrobium sp. CS1GBMeth3]|uniref:GcrA family cell cycle regulator n=1 Tax=Hyphomicrobium sp. CS1GBMeth3 TaxID=1892845 RepID=UPI000931BE2B|nr:GcrA family cell cycle regulator [Hyphomicrobium sp. CS1GBMeth3]